MLHFFCLPLLSLIYYPIFIESQESISVLQYISFPIPFIFQRNIKFSKNVSKIKFENVDCKVWNHCLWRLCSQKLLREMPAAALCMYIWTYWSNQVFFANLLPVNIFMLYHWSIRSEILDTNYLTSDFVIELIDMDTIALRAHYGD